VWGDKLVDLFLGKMLAVAGVCGVAHFVEVPDNVVNIALLINKLQTIRSLM
jgi:hypothetical protein